MRSSTTIQPSRPVYTFFLEKVLDDPTELKQAIRFSFAASILKVVYDIGIQDENDPFVGMIEGMRSPKLWAKWQDAAHKMANEPYMLTKAQMDQGKASQAIVANLLSRVPQYGEVLPAYEAIVEGVGMVAFEGGTDTPTLNELDAVVGSHRLPDFADRDSLVYINALIWEAMR
ncbi:hypothetical protein BD309DRAFT_61703 [Dichomitus squalens]|nr:hypothetical protein BD309DRAFT_61703 [Dichomitus squalens]